MYHLKKTQNAMEVIETTGAEPDLEGEVIRAERVYMNRQFIRAAVYVFAYNIQCNAQRVYASV